MSRETWNVRTRLQRGMGGQSNAIRAEQLRAVGLSDSDIARRLNVPVEAVSRWFDLQNELVLTDDVDGAA